MKTIVLLTFSIFNLFLLPGDSFAQNEKFKELYTKNVISYGYDGFIRNDVRLKYREVSPLLLSYPESAAEFNIYKKKHKIANLFLIPALVTFLAPITGIAKNDNGLGIGLWTASLCLSSTASIFNQEGKKHMQRSVWLYNRDILLQQY
ncbi:MAG: hypothetical protein ABIQ02_02980 [Saprospiraceae bacterium]